MFGDSRKEHICGIATELFKGRRDIKVLDAGAGTGNVGQMVSRWTTLYHGIEKRN